ncbi:MAG TPA: glycerol-3-phosphate 1-O-acyltransferase PlsY [Nitrospirota bacterium]|nr:glycerol-3-phosphate 1-O-acyltransferase PlsY [Nitrospirota bacterium]
MHDSIVLNMVFVVSSYLIGAVPFGLLITRLFAGTDVRSVGSGNIGATNVLRAAGKGAAIVTLLADAFKGFIPAFLALGVTNSSALASLCGAAAVIGHNFPVYLKFKGGKGIATGFGVMLALSPVIGLICLCVWLASAFLWKYSSLAGLLAFAAFPLLIFMTGNRETAYSALSVFLFALIYVRHRENIKRLIQGTEPKIGKKNKQ